MSCTEALIKNVVFITPDVIVADALDIIAEHGIRAVPVVDTDANYYGMFSIHSLMDDLLPLAARMEGGLADLSFVEGGSPGAAKRIRKLAPKPVSSVLQKTPEDAVLTAEIPMLEAIRRLSIYGSPLPVVDKDNKFIGLVSEQSCLNRLAEVLRDVEEEEKQSLNQ